MIEGNDMSLGPTLPDDAPRLADAVCDVAFAVPDSQIEHLDAIRIGQAGNIVLQVQVVDLVDLKRIDAIEPRPGPLDKVFNRVTVEGADVDETFVVRQADDVSRE